MMRESIRRTLESLPPLESMASRSSTRCKICGGHAPLFDVVDFNKHCSHHDSYHFGLAEIEVPYFRCDICGFLFSRFLDDWTKADSARFIYNDDYIRVDPEYSGARATRFAGVTARLLHGQEQLRILDFGSGLGVFRDCLSASGFKSVESYDPFSHPEPPTGNFDVVTCFEVLEHSSEPRATITEMQGLLRPGGMLLFSQSVQPLEIETIRGAWWYLAPRNGHISTFTLDALLRLLPTPSHSLHGNGWLWAMVPSTPQALLAPCVSQLGPKVASLRLSAPNEGDDDVWHCVEHKSETTFRWSRSDTLTWQVDLPDPTPMLLDIHIPFVLEVKPGFATETSLEVNGLPAELVTTPNCIRGQLKLTPRDHEPVRIVLHTPAPTSPFELRGAPDARRLGLGILCC